MLLLFVLLLSLSIGIFLLKKFDNGLEVLGAVFLAVSTIGLLVYFLVLQSNHEYNFSEEYQKYKFNYDLVLTQDSVPFEIKKDLYNDCAFFNDKVKTSIEYNGNIWNGWLYQKPDTTVKCFDLSKFD